LLFISLKLCFISKIYYFNHTINIIKVINTLEIIIFTPQNLFTLPSNITEWSFLHSNYAKKVYNYVKEWYCYIVIACVLKG